MPRGKPVKISSLDEPFATQTAALDFFDKIREAAAIGAILTGDTAKHVAAAYEAYCAATNWPVPNHIVGYLVDWKAEEVAPGEYRNQRCFWYVQDDGARGEFSMKKAVQAISREQNPK
jgi:hypothetical protein